MERARELDVQEHSAAGMLQLVAKTLEAWFAFIASALIYDVAMSLAQSGHGLLLGSLPTHAEFGDIRNLFSGTSWTSPVLGEQPLASKRRSKGIEKLYVSRSDSQHTGQSRGPCNSRIIVA